MTTLNGPSPKFEHKPPARQSLSMVTKAMGSWVPSQFYSEPAVELKSSAVKQVGYCEIAEDGKITVGTQAPAYVRLQKMGYRLEQEKGDKRPPLETEAYEKYAEKKCSLLKTAREAFRSMDQDFICDRSALTDILKYLNETMTGTFRKLLQSQNSIDLVKISKAPGGKGLVLDSLFSFKNLTAEGRPYNGVWKRSERSERGNRFPAWERLASGDTETQCMMITGLKQTSGSRAGKTPTRYIFSEYELGGFKFLTRARTHLSLEKKSVELHHKNWFYKSDVKAMDVYFKLLLGGVDIMATAFHRSGKVVEVFEATTADIVEKMPNVVEAAEKRLGRLVSLLGQVKTEVEKSNSDGPWVLQWQNGDLVLGDYEKVEDAAAKVEEPEPEMVDA